MTPWQVPALESPDQGAIPDSIPLHVLSMAFPGAWIFKDQGGNWRIDAQKPKDNVVQGRETLLYEALQLARPYVEVGPRQALRKVQEDLRIIDEALALPSAPT